MHTHRRRLFSILSLITLFVWGCSSGDVPQATTAEPRDVIPLESMIVNTLGELEGPFFFGKAVAPNVLDLGTQQAETVRVELLGLRATEYPPPPPEAGATPTPEPSIEELAVANQRRQELQDALLRGVTEYFEDAGAFWMLRMSDDNPSKVYLFRPLSKISLSEKDPPSGGAHLINAALLRDGQALMELEGINHPFYEMMLDAQRTAQGGPGSPSKKGVWAQFPLTPPPVASMPPWKRPEETE